MAARLEVFLTRKLLVRPVSLPTALLCRISLSASAVQSGGIMIRIWKIKRASGQGLSYSHSEKGGTLYSPSPIPW